MTDKRTIPASELIINEDGTIFHLHLLPEQIADIVMLVGDPGRVEMVASFFETRQVKDTFRQLTLVRLGTSGALQSDIKVGEAIFSASSVGFDGLLNYYAGRNEVCDLEIEKAFIEHTGWNELLPKPYFIDADPSLAELFKDVTRMGITIAAPGFYAPQGRWVRLQPQDLKLNEKIESFDFGGRKITNFEMESSALAGMAALMGHKAATICTIIAQRIALDACTDYKPFVRQMIANALDKLATL